MTYADALAQVERAAAWLRAAGVGRGDRVLVTARNTADYLLTWFALMEVGAIQVPVNPKSTAAELAGFVEQVEPAAGRDRRRPGRRMVDAAAAGTGSIATVAGSTSSGCSTPSPTARGRPTSTSPTWR